MATELVGSDFCHANDDFPRIINTKRIFLNAWHSGIPGCSEGKMAQTRVQVHLALNMNGPFDEREI